MKNRNRQTLVAQLRPCQHLASLAADHPHALKQVEMVRANRSQVEWPDWCYLPSAAAYAICENIGIKPGTIDAGSLMALSAWAEEKVVIRFDSTAYSYLPAIDGSDKIPHEKMSDLQEWAFYVETTDLTYLGNIVHGFFFYLGYDIVSERKDLCFTLDLDYGFTTLALPIGDRSIDESIHQTLDKAEARLGKRISNLHDSPLARELKSVFQELMKIALAVCELGSYEYSVKSEDGAAVVEALYRRGHLLRLRNLANEFSDVCK